MENTILTKTNPYPNPPYQDINTRRAAPWTHSPVFLVDPQATVQNSPTAIGFYCTAAQPITMSGNRRTDRENYIATHPGNWNEYDFHHTYSFVDGGREHSTCNGQLVLRRNHNDSKPHTGAVKQYQELYRRYAVRYEDFVASDKYNANENSQLAITDSYSDDELTLFEQTHKVMFPHSLRNVYTGQAKLFSYYRTELGDVETIQEIAPVTSSNPWVCSIDFLLNLQHIKAKLAEIGNPTAVPFAFDPCGNVFIAAGNKIYFFDDECDEITKVTGFQ